MQRAIRSRRGSERIAMATVLESNKTKIAKRVIEVFEFFDRTRDTVTVMDIVRCYGRPQSSTSELLTSLCEMGLLYRNPRSRAYSPTPRLATLGNSAQPQIIRNGRLFEFMDEFAAEGPCGVALFGMIGTHVQIFRWARPRVDWGNAMTCGSSEYLSSSAAGLLLLSTLNTDSAKRTLWRINAEAPLEDKFKLAETNERVSLFRVQGQAVGEAGFLAGARVAATLLPCVDGERPLALGAVYPSDLDVDPQDLLRTLERGVEHCVRAQYDEMLAVSEPLSMTA